MKHYKAVRKAGAVIAASFILALLPHAVMAGEEGSSDSSKHEHAEDGVKYLYGNHTCPISGGPVSASSSIVYHDPDNHIYGRIYLCCDGCIAAASKDLAKLYKTLYRTDQKTGKAIEARDLKNEACPISGLSNDKITEYNGMKIGFCCYNCPKAFMKDPEKYMAKLLPDAKEFKLKKDGDASKEEAGSAKDDHEHPHEHPHDEDE